MKDFYPSFSNQYNKTYNTRLNTIRPYIISNEDIKICNKIRDINDYTEECMIIGILFISSDLKTTIFNPKKESTYVSDKNKFYLEDETGRIELVIYNLFDTFISTGMILGFKGKIKLNKFVASEIIYPQKNNFYDYSKKDDIIKDDIIKDDIIKDDIIIDDIIKDDIIKDDIIKDDIIKDDIIKDDIIKDDIIKDDIIKDDIIKDDIIKDDIKKNINKENKIAFISNININKNNKNKENIKVICDYLVMNNINQICIFGPFFREDFDIFKKFIENLNIEILLIPELSDFNCQTYPLLPVHKKLFKKNISSTENPSIYDLRNKVFIFFSYGIIEDLYKYLSESSPDSYKYNMLKIIEGCLDSRLLCPSGPDTLPIIPYTNDELFFIDKPVDYFIIPNCREIIFDNYEDTFILGLPKFEDTNQLIILYILNNEYEIVEFN